MADNCHIEPHHEYETLRQELLESKRYVFERPLAITALAAIGLQVLDKPRHIAVLIAISMLTLFNLWFTVNRLLSASRIVAYIQLVLEPLATFEWEGWESSLRKYRTWLAGKSKRVAMKIVDAELETVPAPDTLMYYSAVYRFHAALMAFAVLAGLIQFKQEPDLWNRLLALIPAAIGAWSLVYFLRWRPARLRFSIERNRVIWRLALESNQPQDGPQEQHELPELRSV